MAVEITNTNDLAHLKRAQLIEYLGLPKGDKTSIGDLRDRALTLYESRRDSANQSDADVGDEDETNAGMIPEEVAAPPEWYDESNPNHGALIVALRDGKVTEEEALAMAEMFAEEEPPKAEQLPDRPRTTVENGKIRVHFEKRRVRANVPIPGLDLVSEGESMLAPVERAARAGRRYSDNDIRHIFKLNGEGAALSKLAKRFNCSTTFMGHILKRESYKDVDLRIAYDPTILPGDATSVAEEVADSTDAE